MYLLLINIHVFTTQKLEERWAILNKMDFNDKTHHERWFEALQVDTMSSEESDKENDEDILVVRPLSWRSSEFEKLLNIIDKEREVKKSSQAKRQLMKRVNGPFLARNQPDSVPKWD